MNKFLALLAVAVFLGAACTRAAEVADTKPELQQLVDQVNARLKTGARTEQEFAAELKQFDALAAKYQGEKTDDAAQILVMKAALYLEVFGAPETAATMIKDVKAKFPDTGPGKKADAMLAAIDKQVAAQKLQRSLVVGGLFPDFDEKDLLGKPVSVGRHKGKAVLVVFWATWCGPCLAELPGLLKVYEKHHAKGFEIIGISIDREQPRLDAFLKKEKLPWPLCFDGDGKLAELYGIEAIPANFLIDPAGKIVARDLSPGEIDSALAKFSDKK